MKALTERDLREELGWKQVESYTIEPGTLVTPSARQFLKERKINIDFKRNSNDISKYLKANLAEIWFNDNVAGLIRNQGDFYIESCLHYYKQKHPKNGTENPTKVVRRKAKKPIKRV